MMTHEQRLDRLERIAKLFVKAGLRARRQGREQDEKINMLINQQIRNDEKFAQHEEKFAGQDEKFANLIEFHTQNEERFAKLAESQANTDRQLTLLIETVREGRNGGSLPKSNNKGN